jgi:hypothetical protein
MRVAIALLFVAFVIGWLVLGALLGDDVLCSSNEDNILAAASVGLIVTNAALMIMFAEAVPPGGTLTGRLALALVTATISATLISGGFWIGISTADFTCEDTSDTALVLVILWALTAGVMAVAGIVAWGITRLIVRTMTR